MYDDLFSLKLHVADNGEVWYCLADKPPVNSGRSLAVFLMHPLSEIPKIRIMGTQQNAHLILLMHLKRLSVGSLEICGTQICNVAADRHDPECVLFAMRQCERAGSTGGWHRTNYNDYATYALISHLQKTGRADAMAESLIKLHPAWPALSFIEHLDIAACCQLLTLIIDPRWYIDTQHPNRGAKLCAYLGLDKVTMRSGTSAGETPKRYYKRCELVYDCWNGPKNLKLVEKPNYFLWRIFRDHGERGGPIIGALRTSQTFIRYLQLTWLAALSTQAEPLFVPEYFFNEKYEVTSYNAHIESLRGVKIDGTDNHTH